MVKHQQHIDREDYLKLLTKVHNDQLEQIDWQRVRRQAYRGDVGAQYILSFANSSARTRKKWLKAAANSGHAEAFSTLYGAYPVDNRGDWLRISAEMGSSEAQSALASFLATTSPPDLVQSRHWFLKAAQQASPTAMYELGFMMLLGEGGPAAPAEGVRWLEKAACTASYTAEDARRLLSDIYKNGQYGLEKNDELAHRWSN